MDDRIAALLKLSFRVADARDANAAIADVRGDGKRRSYEMVLAPDATFEQLAAEVVPRVVYHLECVRAHLPQCEGVFLSIFVGERLHFVEPALFLGLCGEYMGLSLEAMARRFGPPKKPRPPPLLLA